MRNHIFIFAFFGIFGWVRAQNPELPQDFRQHNLTYFNASLFNPVFSMDQRAGQSLALWSRWQWQDIDADPSTLLVNFNRRLPNAAIGAGFIQHNTGLFTQTGGILNAAYQLRFSENVSLKVGVNLLGYQQKLSDAGLSQNNPLLFPDPDFREFIVQMAPGAQLQLGSLALSVASDNFFDYSFTNNSTVSEGTQKIFTGSVHYTFPVVADSGAGATTLRPLVYLKSVPGFENQVGGNILGAGPWYWVQGGYDTFYGVSAGLGVTILKKFSIGGLVEFGSGNEPENQDPTFEILAAWSMGSLLSEKEPEMEEASEDGAEELEAAAAREAEMREMEEAAQRQRDSINAAVKRQELAMKRRDSIEAQRQADLLEQTRIQDSIQKAGEQLALKEEVKPEQGEKYQEVSREEGLSPGFYLIANVFGTQRYFEAFMKSLKEQGLEPRSFYRSANKYNYVYLQRYNSMSEARAARDSKFSGRYSGDLWIFRVK